MNNNQRIECYVRDCKHCINGKQCCLNKIKISKDIHNENTKYNTMCQSYEESID